MVTLNNNVVLSRDFFKDKIASCKDYRFCDIPAAFTEIGSQAFYDWVSCRYVIIPDTVTKIAEDAFLWDNIRLVFSNNSLFQDKHSFKVLPNVNQEINQCIFSLFDSIEAIDEKVDIKSEDIALKRESINREIELVFQKLEERKIILQDKTDELDKIYTDLLKKSDDSSNFISDIKKKVNQILVDSASQQVKSIEDEYNKYSNLQKKDMEDAKNNFLKLQTDTNDYIKKNERKLTKLKTDFNEVSESILKKKSQLADEISKMALEKAQAETPFKMISIVIDNKKIESNKPKILHHQFEDVIKLVVAGFNPLLVGPAGCGKNVIIEQVADTLGWKFYYVNDVTEEYKVMGFVDANGRYCKTQFYEAFTNGGFIMIDELDQSNAAALLAINSAIGTGYHEYASFPDGKLYPKHTDFHIAAAANTYGNGANMLYCGRNQLDVASLNRFIPIFINYDHNLEANLVSNQAFLPFYWKIREIIEANRIRQVISTRNIVNAGKMIANELFALEKIFDFTIIQGMNQDDLRIILNGLNESKSTGIYEDQFVNYLQKVKKIDKKGY